MNSILKIASLLFLFTGSFNTVFSQVNYVQVIDSIFMDYVQYQESVDSDLDKKTIASSIEKLDSNLSIEDLIVVINVWMYYDPTDFSVSSQCENALVRNYENALAAINSRVENKKDWEREGSAPYSDLPLLRDRIEKKKTEHN